MIPKINSDQVPRAELNQLSCTLLAALERFYADPENLKRYRDWLAVQNKTVSNTQ